MDWCNSAPQDPRAAYPTMSKALNQSGRHIGFNMCEWGRENPWEWGGDIANSWRMSGDHTGPINLGNPDEFTIRELAELVRIQINPKLQLVEKPLPQDDPQQRQPAIDLAREQLNWQPTVSLEQGLAPTIDSFRNLLGSAEGCGT